MNNFTSELTHYITHNIPWLQRPVSLQPHLVLNIIKELSIKTCKQLRNYDEIIRP